MLLQGGELLFEQLLLGILTTTLLQGGEPLLEQPVLGLELTRTLL